MTDRSELLGLERLSEIADQLMTADSIAAVADLSLEAITEDYKADIAAIWKYDPEAERLDPIAHTDAVREVIGDVPAFDAGSSLAWEAFTADELHLVDDVTDEPDVYNAETPFRSEIIVPLDAHGVLIAADTDVGTFTEFDAEYLSLFSKIIAGAWERVEQSRSRRIAEQVHGRVLRHNLRNGLQPVIGSANYIQSAATEQTIEDRAAIITDEAKNLLRTAEKTRWIQELTDRPGDLREFDLTALLGDICDDVATQYPDADLRYEVGDAVTVRAHAAAPAAIEDVVVNAIQHAESSSPSVRVAIEAGESLVCLTVSDDGPGIPSEEIRALKAGGETPLQHGSGVGLWLADRVAYHSNGSLSVDVDDAGSDVTLCLQRS